MASLFGPYEKFELLIPWWFSVAYGSLKYGSDYRSRSFVNYSPFREPATCALKEVLDEAGGALKWRDLRRAKRGRAKGSVLQVPQGPNEPLKKRPCAISCCNPSVVYGPEALSSVI